MNPQTTCIALLAFLSSNYSLCLAAADPTTPVSNVTVMGTVFCDPCASNYLSPHSYFLEGVKVRVQCMFWAETSKEKISIMVQRMTDKFGVYKLDIPPVDGFECREGLEMESCCRASLLGSPSSSCVVPGLSSSTEHMAIRGGGGKQCLYNLNALNYRPLKKDTDVCGNSGVHLPSPVNSPSLFFWPPFPPFGFLGPPSLPFPFPAIPYPTRPPPSSTWPQSPDPYFFLSHEKHYFIYN